ncbi:porin [Vibrio metschnikovii]|uniref:porin n=1 Tax=Vibrio metschnikovii TaxID=28172 RepID=UPI001C305A50|nr:porin [Vibrio metschnikovii]
MKQAAVTTAILAALVSGSSLAATVYSADGTELRIGGRVEFRGDFIGDKGAEIDGTMKDSTRARLNVRGSTQVADDLRGFAFYEAEQNTGTSEFKNRYMYVGFATNIGDLSFGKQNMAAVQISDLTDTTEFSGIQQYISSASDKTDSVIAYRGQFDALNLQATYAASSKDNADLYGISGLYSLPIGLDFGAAYSAGDNGVGKGKQNQWLLGVGYKLDALSLGATYSFGDNDDKANSEFNALELAAAYKLNKQMTLKGVYGKSEDKVSGNKTDSADFFELAAYYQFNSALRSYISYKLNNLDDVVVNGVETQSEDTLRFGLRYDF